MIVAAKFLIQISLWRSVEKEMFSWLFSFLCRLSEDILFLFVVMNSNVFIY